jgi:hypothetical protein
MSSELASLIDANTRIDGTFPTPVPGLHLSRYSSRTPPGQGVVQCPTLAIVAQGSKQLMLGDEAFTYAPGFCLVVSLDLPSLEESRVPRKQNHSSGCTWTST